MSTDKDAVSDIPIVYRSRFATNHDVEEFVSACERRCKIMRVVTQDQSWTVQSAIACPDYKRPSINRDKQVYATEREAYAGAMETLQDNGIMVEEDKKYWKRHLGAVDHNVWKRYVRGDHTLPVLKALVEIANNTEAVSQYVSSDGYMDEPAVDISVTANKVTLFVAFADPTMPSSSCNVAILTTDHPHDDHNFWQVVHNVSELTWWIQKDAIVSIDVTDSNADSHADSQTGSDTGSQAGSDRDSNEDSNEGSNDDMKDKTSGRESDSEGGENAHGDPDHAVKKRIHDPENTTDEQSSPKRTRTL
jgi:hypothetical protein